MRRFLIIYCIFISTLFGISIQQNLPLQSTRGESLFNQLRHRRTYTSAIPHALYETPKIPSHIDFKNREKLLDAFNILEKKPVVLQKPDSSVLPKPSAHARSPYSRDHRISLHLFERVGNHLEYFFPRLHDKLKDICSNENDYKDLLKIFNGGQNIVHMEKQLNNLKNIVEFEQSFNKNIEQLAENPPGIKSITRQFEQVVGLEKIMNDDEWLKSKKLTSSKLLQWCHKVNLEPEEADLFVWIIDSITEQEHRRSLERLRTWKSELIELLSRQNL